YAPLTRGKRDVSAHNLPMSNVLTGGYEKPIVMATVLPARPLPLVSANIRRGRPHPLPARSWSSVSSRLRLRSLRKALWSAVAAVALVLSSLIGALGTAGTA